MAVPERVDVERDPELVSVIIVTWNGKKWLRRCLDSVYAQTYPHVEPIVVDNASTDDTVKYLREVYPELTVIESAENVGFAAGNNLGIAAAQGGQILLLNSDTWLEPDGVSRLLEEQRERGLDVIGPREGDYWTGVPRSPYSAHIDVWGHPVFRELKSHPRPSFYISGVCLLFAFELYARTGGLDSAYFMYNEEVDWFWRLALTGRTFAYSHDVVVYHAGMGSGGQGIDVQRFQWRNHNTLQMLITNYQLVTLAWVLPTYALECMCEALILAAIGRRDVAATYPRGWWLAVRDLRKLLSKRRQVQAERCRSDQEIRSTMYMGIGKLHHLRAWLQDRA